MMAMVNTMLIFHNQDNYEQIALVLNVVMNRVNSDVFQDTVEEVMGTWTILTDEKVDNGLPEVSDISLKIVKRVVSFL